MITKEISPSVGAKGLCTVKHPVNDGEQRSPARDQGYRFNPHTHAGRDICTVHDNIDLSKVTSEQMKFSKLHKKPPVFSGGCNAIIDYKKIKPVGNGRGTGDTKGYDYYTAFADISQAEARYLAVCGGDIL